MCGKNWNACDPGKVVESAVVLEFVGGVSCCSGGLAANGDCCETQARENDTCGDGNVGVPTTITEECCGGETTEVGDKYQCFQANDPNNICS